MESNTFFNDTPESFLQSMESSGMLKRVFQLIEKELLSAKTVQPGKVVNFHHPHELRKMLPLDVPEDGLDEQTLTKLCKTVLKYSVRTGHPFFYNQLFGSPEQASLAGAVLTECMNVSCYTFEVGPVFILMEEAMFSYMRGLVGWKAGDGIFCPGGSISNMYALSLARYRKFPEAKRVGMLGLPTLRLYTSEHAHYSLKKGAAFMGFGLDNLVQIKCDAQGRMLPEALEASIVADKKAGLTPLFVNATAGTTVSGAYDPLVPLADICKRHGLWLHIDGCLGASCLVSPKLRGLMAGAERADSLAWNQHKVMGVPLQCAAFLTRHSMLMREAHSAAATYLFQQDKFYDTSFDTGDKSIQCGRKADIFKLWLGWQALGESGLAHYVEHKFGLAQGLGAKIREREGFELVFEPSCTNVCFWYVPPSLRRAERTEEWWTRLHKVAPEIKQGMVEKGSMMLGYQPLLGKVNFFRMVTSQVQNTAEDMDKVLDTIEELGKDLCF